MADLKVGNIRFGPPLTPTDARAVRRSLEDTTRDALTKRDYRAVCDSGAQRILGLREQCREQIEEIDLLQRIVETLTDGDCECGICKQCTCRGILQGSLRRYPRRQR